MMKKLFALLMIVTLLTLIPNAYANSELIIKDIILVEPTDGQISGKESISVKAIIANSGDRDINSPFSASILVNDRGYSRCYDRCSLPSSGKGDLVEVKNGLKAGQAVEMYWGSSASDREYLRVGKNTLTFVAQIAGGETIEKTFTFDLEEGNLPQIDMAISDLSVDIKDRKIKSVSALITNNGPSTVKDDVIQISVSVKKADGAVVSGMGGFIDLQQGVCDSSIYDCEMSSGDVNTWESRGFSSINNQLRPGNYLLTLRIDEINGLKYFEETNMRNNEITEEFVIESSNTNPTKESNWFNIKKGWNFVWGLADPNQITGGLEVRNIKAIYAFNYEDREYVRTHPNPETDKLQNLPDSYYSTTAYWVYSDQNANIEYVFETPASKFTLKKGINFLGINPSMEGKTLSEISDCEFTGIWAYLSEGGSEPAWVKTDPDFPEKLRLAKEHAGFGLLVKVADDCAFDEDASEDITSIPPFPN